jgi:hypothetical protein
MNQRLTVYRRLAGVRSESELQRAIDEVRDRYGTPPPSIDNLAEYALIRVLADRVGIESIDREGQTVVLKFRPEAKVDPTWLFRVVQGRKDVHLSPPATLKLDMRAPAEVRQQQRAAAILPGGTKVVPAPPKASWWTARATAGEVAPGFSRNEILKPAKEDPRAEGGVFSRVARLLRELSEGVVVR